MSRLQDGKCTLMKDSSLLKLTQKSNQDAVLLAEKMMDLARSFCDKKISRKNKLQSIAFLDARLIYFSTGLGKQSEEAKDYDTLYDIGEAHPSTSSTSVLDGFEAVATT